ncbi:MAG: glycosyltransferase family 39 protein, partial [Planctomycetales bacterium]|nr:glycosyltransferase family 39 protein [Planctomycetales bacterium]
MKTDAGSPRKNSDSIKFWGIVALLLAVHAGLAIDAARQLSVTHDEYWHLPVGLLTWRTARFDFDNLNPPLTRLWSALPLSVTGCQAGDVQNAHDAFGYGDAFRAAHSDDYDRQFFAGRIMTVLLSVVSGAWLAGWSRQLFGTRGGLLTAALWAFCPNMLANAGLVTPDIGLTGAFIVTLHAAWRFARTPSWKSAGWLGLCLGAAQLVKFTSLLLYPLILVAWGGVRWLRRDPSVASVPFRRGLALWACALLLSLLTLNAGYLFRGTGAAIESYSFGSRSLTWFNTAPAWVRSLPVPFPRDYLAGLDRQRQIMEGAHPVFLDGEWRTHGFPQYYLWALAYKTPHGVQAIGLLTVVAWVFVGGRGRPLGVGLLALSGMLLLLLVASTSGMQLGLRYVLPVYPLLYLIAGQVPQVVANWRPIPSQLGRGLLLVGVISLPFAARFHP